MFLGVGWAGGAWEECDRAWMQTRKPRASLAFTSTMRAEEVTEESGRVAGRVAFGAGLPGFQASLLLWQHVA